MNWKSQYILKQTLDDWAIKQIFHNRKTKALVKLQKIDVSAHSKLGSDLAVARFVTGRIGGLIRNEKGHWIKREADLPPEFTESFKVTAIKVANSGLVDEGIDNFVGLNHLESIDLSLNPKLDDFACDMLARQFRSSKNLREVNLSNNPLISLYGLDVLFRIPSINRIIAVNTLATEHEESDLFVVCAEDERQCDVFLHEGGKKHRLPELEQTRVDVRYRIASH